MAVLQLMAHWVMSSLGCAHLCACSLHVLLMLWGCYLALRKHVNRPDCVSKLSSVNIFPVEHGALTWGTCSLVQILYCLVHAPAPPDDGVFSLIFIFLPSSDK